MTYPNLDTCQQLGLIRPTSLHAVPIGVPSREDNTMATKKLRRGLRIPIVVTPTKTPTKKAAKKATKKRAPTTKRRVATTLRDRVDQQLAEIAARLENVDTEYWEIGQALVALDTPEVWTAYGLRSYRAFLDEHVMPFSTARRLITVAKRYTKAIAKQIGLERGWQLDRLARIDPKIKRSPQQLWQRNTKLGSKKKPVRQMTGPEIEALVRGAQLRSAKTNIRKPSVAMKQSVKNYKKKHPYETDVDIDLKRSKVHVTIDLEEFLEHY